MSMHQGLSTQLREYDINESERSAVGQASSRDTSPTSLPSIGILLKKNVPQHPLDSESWQEDTPSNLTLPPMQAQTCGQDMEALHISEILSNPFALALESLHGSLRYGTSRLEQPKDRLEARCFPKSPDQSHLLDKRTQSTISERDYSPNASCEPDGFDQHVLLCVTFFGWAATRSMFKLEPCWDGLQRIYDSYLWKNVSKLQVLSMMDFDLAVLKSLRDPSVRSLPAFGRLTYVLASLPRHSRQQMLTILL